MEFKVSIHTPPWGRDAGRTEGQEVRHVSIHTPPWGRDILYAARRFFYRFQFTRPRGGAICSLRGRSPDGSFNSHAPVGARCKTPRRCRQVQVSIHTPPWGRDSNNIYYSRNGKFQFTRPRGGAMPRGARAICRDWFQFTRPRGGAIATTSTTRATASFNSHAPVGARCHGVPVRFVAIGFNSHAPVGARYYQKMKCGNIKVSIHTPPWGRDLQSL